MTDPSRLRDSGNHLLDGIPAAEFASLEPWIQRVQLALKEVVHQFDADVTHLHFPTTAMLSLLTVFEDDDPVETATVGSEGFAGMAAAMGVVMSPHRVLCQMKGESIRLPVAPFLETLSHAPGLTRVIHLYNVYSLRVASQGLACNLQHSVEARACRWLLLMDDQAEGGEFPMTQEFMAYMLGVRRQTVTVIAGTLQGAGLISYHRGMMHVLDRPQLEDAACECYDTIRKYYERVGL